MNKMKKMMEMMKTLIHAWICSFLLIILVHAQDQSGFISIDCGLQIDSYTDTKTGIYYVSDENFIQTGVSKSISPEYGSNSLEKQYLNVRSFPQGIRNCYTLKPSRGRGDKYLIRATFMYGNYDGNHLIPEFELHLGVNLWDSVKFVNASDIGRKEIIHNPKTDYIDVCLVNIGSGIPFISALELRLLKNSTYELESDSQALVLYRRLDMGSLNNETFRYGDDAFDRIWEPKNFLISKQLSTSLTVGSQAPNDYQPPSIVMRTAVALLNESKPLSISWIPKDSNSIYYAYLHFAEVEKLEENEIREFNLTDKRGNVLYQSFVPNYLNAYIVYGIIPTFDEEEVRFYLVRTERSTLPPILNALEVYLSTNLLQSQTDQKDVDAMVNIKSIYGITKNWQGDPCAPQAYSWDGLNCSYSGYSPPRIIALNLSSSGLTGEITANISNLQLLQNLDLSNNSLTGPVPDFLTQLPSLKVLNLKGNNFTGSIPNKLLERSKKGSLSLSIDGNGNENENPNPNVNEKKKKNKIVVPLVVSVAALFIILATLAIIWRIKRQKEKVNETPSTPTSSMNEKNEKNEKFTYEEVLRMTNNLERSLGRGGFGTVYHGYLNNAQVAVKILASSSTQGDRQFQAEVKILMKVHHKTLTSLVGYCNEDGKKALIYEYMANGDLQMCLKDKNNAYVLSWEERLKIALDAAQGLEYMHYGCKPPIIHRDVKSTNILLNENLQAKLADFGLSRMFPVEGDTHVSTIVAGTLGYLDPEYFDSNHFSQKSDVYSFGVVLLEIITNQPVISHTEENKHISKWVSFMCAKDENVRNIVDPRLMGNFDINSAWNAVEIAMACVSTNSSNRPTMSDVVVHLTKCLDMTHISSS